MISEFYLKQCLKIRKEYKRLTKSLENKTKELEVSAHDLLENIEQYERELTEFVKYNSSKEYVIHETDKFFDDMEKRYHTLDNEILDTVMKLKNLIRTGERLNKDMEKKYPHYTQKQIQEEVIKYLHRNNVN